MPVGRFEDRDEAEKAAIERHIASVHQMGEWGADAGAAPPGPTPPTPEDLGRQT